MQSFIQNIIKQGSKIIPTILGIISVCAILYFIRKDQWHFALLIPAVLTFTYWFIFKLDTLFYILAFSVPISASLEMLRIYNPLGFEVSLPSEPLLIALLGVAGYKLIFYFDLFKDLLKHPIFKGIIFYLLTIIFTSITSTMHVVSVKFVLSRLWLMLPCLIFGYIIFRENKNYYRFIALLSLGTSLVVIYSILNLASYSFDLQAAHFAMQPFYKDHTVYGASITLIAFLSFFQIGNRNLSSKMRLFFIATTAIIAIGIVFSYTRASWVSIIAAIGVYVVMRLRISFNVLAATVISLGIFLFSFSNEILDTLDNNSQDSSGNFSEHISSMSNISTDASNLERLNRWYCAIALWKDYPIIGSGPGTYQFLYAPYQKPGTRSLISTNDGDGGNAHSEYLGVLSDSGIIGFLGLAVMLYITLRYGIRLYYKIESKSDKRIIMGILLALISYFIHGVLNNYLDSDKCAVPIWTSICMLIVLGIKHQNAIKQKKTPELN